MTTAYIAIHGLSFLIGWLLTDIIILRIKIKHLEDQQKLTKHNSKEI